MSHLRRSGAILGCQAVSRVDAEVDRRSFEIPSGSKLLTAQGRGGRGYPLINIGSGGDVILAGSGASSTELLRLVSVRPLYKSFGPAFRQGNMNLVDPSKVQVKAKNVVSI